MKEIVLGSNVVAPFVRVRRQDFVVSFFVELSVMMLERLYLDPGTKEVRFRWPCCCGH